MNFSSPSNCWTIINAVEASIKAKIAEHGKKLSEWNISIYRGILTGYNEAFIIDSQKKEELILEDPKSAEIIRPILRGRDVDRYKYNFAGQYLINVHNGIKNTCTLPINIEKYPAIKNHLNRWLETLKDRQDQGVTPYNLRNCAYMDDFSKPKIIWKRIGSKIRFAYDNTGCYVLDSTCFATGPMVKYLVAILNSKLGNYMLQDSPKTGTGDLIISVQAIEPLLIPVPSEETRANIEQLVDGILKETAEEKLLEKEIKIDQIVFELYNLNDEEKRYIESII